MSVTPELIFRMTAAVDVLEREMVKLGDSARALVIATENAWGEMTNIWVREAVAQMPPADYERLARRVAVGYNRAHPHRKLSWRRLNRPQRRVVVAWWMRKG